MENKLKNDLNFINSPEHSNSLRLVMANNEDGVPDDVAYKMLGFTSIKDYYVSIKQILTKIKRRLKV